MNAEINPMYMSMFHPVRVDGDAIHALALWLKENGSRQLRQQSDVLSVMSERYPAGLFTADEVQVLYELENN